MVGAKTRLLSESAVRPGIALRFATKLPNAGNEEGIGLDTMDFYNSLLIGKTIRSLRVVGNVGLGILSDPTRGDRQNDVMTYGISFARAFAEGAEIVGEVNGRANTRRGDPPPGTDSSGYVRFGARLTRGLVRVDAALVAGLTPHDAGLRRDGGADVGVPRAGSAVSGPGHAATLGFVKAHAYGNDFLLVEEGDVEGAPLDVLARAICRRQHGIGPTG